MMETMVSGAKERPLKHLEEVNMTYWQHLKHAWSIAFILLVHGLFPNIWKNKASESISRL